MVPGIMVAADYNSDKTLKAACDYRSQNVYKVMAGNSISNVVPLIEASKAQFDQATIGKNVVYITGVAHGLADSFPASTSVDPTILTASATGYDPAALKGTIVHLLSCYVGALLGAH